MNKKWIVMLASVAITSVSVAQTTPPPPGPPPPPMSKEEKEKLRLKQEEDLAAAYKEAGITEEQVAKIKAEEQAARARNKVIDDSVRAVLETAFTKETYKKIRDIHKKHNEDIKRLPPPPAPLSKEEKAALKAKQEEELVGKLKAEGITDEQVKQYLEADKKGYELKSAVGKEKDKKVVEIAGAENIKKFKEIQKRQKEAAAPPKPM